MFSPVGKVKVATTFPSGLEEGGGKNLYSQPEELVLPIFYIRKR
jgi:hypothetical protein